ncbi:Maf family protein [Spiribacter vilamensis]|uniref:dTTP/UTP pyrophosphatase n=1 Tax=Spiribacter vilamensis TaxID=531306 RepID=A0A4Q8CXY5_9GAMM|nr:nucleoside triphosphate pyrophosphatase [Spiribacter vilamensis]RZU97826.1 septum formation protein [Spiribacter vilamensis]TVO61250.1 septum formation inhibitor Maf [Spiribacter vilamensis]
MTDAQHPDYSPDLYLASASPRRAEILERMGVRFQCIPQAIDEQVQSGESPEVLVFRLALEKARAGLAALKPGTGMPVLGADTAVVIDDDILGKPDNRDDAMAMLERLSGRTHRVLTGIAMVDGQRELTRLSLSMVTLRSIGATEQVAYWQSGEPLDKAGAYAIQGRGGVFVEQLEGSYSGVMGLPMVETHSLLVEFGIDYQLRWPAGQ